MVRRKEWLALGAAITTTQAASYRSLLVRVVELLVGCCCSRSFEEQVEVFEREGELAHVLGVGCRAVMMTNVKQLRRR